MIKKTTNNILCIIFGHKDSQYLGKHKVEVESEAIILRDVHVYLCHRCREVHGKVEGPDKPRNKPYKDYFYIQ